MGLTHVLAPDTFSKQKIVNKWQVTYVPQFTMWTPAYIPIENKRDVVSMQFSYDTIRIGIRIKMMLWERKNCGVPIRYVHGVAPA